MNRINWEVVLIIGLVLLFVGIVIVADRQGDKEYQAFMTECMNDGKKHYECKALWRAGEPDYVPVYIPVPTGR